MGLSSGGEQWLFDWEQGCTMGLSKEQQASYVKNIRISSARPVRNLPDQVIAAMVCRTAKDVVDSGVLGQVPADLATLASYAASLPDLYEAPSASVFTLETTEPPRLLFERLVTCGVGNLDSYFYCLVDLHKRRLKYESILSPQAFPRIEQIGPRAMLQYGQADPAALTVLLTWRKWIYDIDNRAGQETGYVFEPSLASALGGAKFSARSSPIRRSGDSGKGRQVDCVVETPEGKWAYEFKIRVTIAASGQGRRPEELSFPQEAQAAGYTPVLLVFDDTANEYLAQLCTAYGDAGGTAYTGQFAWEHVEERSGAVMGFFVDKYLREPLADLISQEPDRGRLPSIEFGMRERQVVIAIDGWEPMTIDRAPDTALIDADEEDAYMDEEDLGE